MDNPNPPLLNSLKKWHNISTFIKIRPATIYNIAKLLTRIHFFLKKFLAECNITNSSIYIKQVALLWEPSLCYYIENISIKLNKWIISTLKLTTYYEITLDT